MAPIHFVMGLHGSCKCVIKTPALTYMQSVVEMFLGLRLGAHFPSVRVPYAEQPAAGADSASEDGSDAEEDSSLKLAAARQARCCMSCSAAWEGVQAGCTGLAFPSVSAWPSGTASKSLEACCWR